MRVCVRECVNSCAACCRIVFSDDGSNILRPLARVEFSAIFKHADLRISSTVCSGVLRGSGGGQVKTLRFHGQPPGTRFVKEMDRSRLWKVEVRKEMLDQVFANGIAYLRYVICHGFGEGLVPRSNTLLLPTIYTFLRPCFFPFCSS